MRGHVNARSATQTSVAVEHEEGESGVHLVKDAEKTGEGVGARDPRIVGAKDMRK